MLIGEYVQQFEPGINDANNTANSALVQSQEALDQAKNATAIANEALGQSRASVIELINSVNASTVTLIGNKNDGSQTTTNLPVASELQAGVMNTATYVNLKDLNSRVTSLESNTTTYIVVLPNDNPTQAEILNAYRTAYPLAPNPPLDGTTVIDVDKQLFYRYVKNGNIWIKTSGFNVTPFTNENAGIIKGSTTPGQIQAETDGTGSLVGYDTLVSNIAQNTTAIGTANSRIDAVETKNTDQDTAITNVSNIANHALAEISIAPGSGDVKINQTRGNGNTDTASIPAVTTSLAGIVTPTMFNQWNTGYDPLPNHLTDKGNAFAAKQYDIEIGVNRYLRVTITAKGSTYGITITNPGEDYIFVEGETRRILGTQSIFTFGANSGQTNSRFANIDIISTTNKFYHVIINLYVHNYSAGVSYTIDIFSNGNITTISNEPS